MDDNNSRMPEAGTNPFEINTTVPFDEMRSAILANDPEFSIIEANSGHLYPLFPHCELTNICHNHVYMADAINEAYLQLRRLLLLECAIMELNKPNRNSIL